MNLINGKNSQIESNMSVVHSILNGSDAAVEVEGQVEMLMAA